MNQYEFYNEAKRLKSTFDARYYPEERLKVIYDAVKSLPNSWWTQTVSQLIAECRQPPMLKEIQHHIDLHEEERYRREKNQHRREAEQFWQGVFFPEDQALMIRYIKQRMEGNVLDKDWSKFMEQITSAANSAAKRGCLRCDNSGVVFTRDENGYEIASKCGCSTARADLRKFRFDKDADERERTKHKNQR